MSESSDEGQVSEAQNLRGDPDTPVSDSQSVGGQPDDGAGPVDEGPQGPNAITNGPHADGWERTDRGDHGVEPSGHEGDAAEGQGDERSLT